MPGAPETSTEKQQGRWIRWKKAGSAPLDKGSVAPLASTGDDELDEVLARRRAWAMKHLGAMRANFPLNSPRLSDVDTAFLTDATLVRYLEARDGDVAKATAMLTASLTWRRQHNLDVRERKFCSACARDPNAHCFLPLGKDRRGWEVVYSCAARSADKTVATSVEHLSCTVDRLFDGGAGPGKMTWIVDMRGSGVREFDPKMGSTIAPMFSSHFPERMYALHRASETARRERVSDTRACPLPPLQGPDCRARRAELISWHVGSREPLCRCRHQAQD